MFLILSVFMKGLISLALDTLYRLPMVSSPSPRCYWSLDSLVGVLCLPAALRPILLEPRSMLA